MEEIKRHRFFASIDWNVSGVDACFLLTLDSLTSVAFPFTPHTLDSFFDGSSLNLFFFSNLRRSFPTRKKA